MDDFMAINCSNTVDGKHVSKIWWGLVEGNEEKLWQCHRVMVLVFKKEDETNTLAMPRTCLIEGSDSKKTKARPFTAS
jgi:hypothetical protein